MSSVASDPASAEARLATTVQKAAAAVGAAFLLVGTAGFVPGVTTQYDTMQGAGHESMAMLLGVFMVSVLHNIVHLLFGVAGLAASGRWQASRVYLLAGGAVYLVLWIYGLLIDKNSGANFVPVNAADNWLHLGLGVVMVGAGVALSRARSSVPAGRDGQQP